MGKTLEEAQSISNKEIADYLGGLPAEKMHCVVLGRQALEKAIESQRGTPVEEKKGEVICECFGITDLEIQKAVTENSLSTIEEVTNYTKAGGGCKKCHEKILSLLETLRSRVEAKKAAETKPRLTNIRKIRLIEETIDREIRPSLRHDGGDIELIDVVGDRVLVATRGTCAACRAAERTLKGFVEVRLREMVSPELVVEEVSP
jgi:NifU-like protein